MGAVSTRARGMVQSGLVRSGRRDHVQPGLPTCLSRPPRHRFRRPGAAPGGIEPAPAARVADLVEKREVEVFELQELGVPDEILDLVGSGRILLMCQPVSNIS